ncbi:hypothetical protein NDU88_002624 [Pleurodeles waltl]|uniref:Uncharacterized protein n=1 Tax=Pleurodeles waltl TaxID=8319 RepID=A0AAV7MN73_PLEWA|nr:hypothetical protein NDU88_002624 [Pleurodeles waltl]
MKQTDSTPDVMAGADLEDESEPGGKRANMDKQSGVGGVRWQSGKDGGNIERVQDGKFKHPDAAGEEESGVTAVEVLNPEVPGTQRPEEMKRLGREKLGGLHT